ncbi:hypothetical protein I8J29_32370 [Paenibacillus sp. MWE-103]|uniref:Uncharacterized protein n=1 Tax=Paenibacillus artemisiicola TaxID=1172618 RepID=A0ABS3WKL9_9BACL|nr:hypothetical protein [Paenibacillus artemisiicola]MBO7748878.1 hypothetical protein [Paenibacillus artemisiicola]
MSVSPADLERREAERTRLSAGLAVIAGCLAETGDVWRAHYGAAAIASWLFRRDAALAPGAEAAAARQTDAMLAAHPPGARFLAAADVPVPAAEAERAIADALRGTLDGLHWVGHNFIYAAHAISALRALGGWGSAEAIGGIAGLIARFRGTIPGRSWIGFKAGEVKRLAAASYDAASMPSDPVRLSAAALGELAAFKRIYRAEAHHDLIGHLLTFAHALNALHDCGYADLFRAGVPQWLAIAEALRAGRDLPADASPRLVSPVDRLPLRPAARSARLPAEEAFWTRDYAAADWDFGHVFKFPCSFYDHLRRAPDGPPAAAAENFRRLLPDVHA